MEEKVKKISDEIYGMGFTQFVIDFVQDEVEELFQMERVGRDHALGTSAQIYFMLEVFNPKFEKDIDFLQRLSAALDEWGKEIEKNNIAQGLPKEA